MRLVVLCAPLILVSCARNDRSPLDGVAVLVEQIQLQRGQLRDTAQREIAVDRDATYVAIVEESDADVRVILQTERGAREPAAAIDVESHFSGEGIEVATLEALAGDRLVLKLEGPHDFARPFRVPVKLIRYDAQLRAQPRMRARLDALRAWSAATRFDLTADGMRATGFKDLDAAIDHLQSPDGDPHLAAWAWLVRANRSYTYYLGWRPVLHDARRAEQAFLRLGESRNAARARMMQAAALVEIALDTNATDPTPQEAAREGVAMFTSLSTEPALSARERARSVNFLGYFKYNSAAAAAVPYFERALAQFRAIGDLYGELIELTNLGGIAAERGEFRQATQIYDELLARLDELSLPERRAGQLVNAASIDILSRNSGRAIERFMALLQMAREQHLRQYESRALAGLSYAYLELGDLAQAEAFGKEALKLYRKLEDPIGLLKCLRVLGNIARDSGDYAAALAYHRETLERAPEGGIHAQLLADLARDYLVMGDADRAIGALRLAIADPSLAKMPARRQYVQLPLAEALLARKSPTTRDIGEALSLAIEVLNGARESADLTMEWSAHKVIAQAHVARSEYEDARREYERAIEIIFRYRATTASPELQSTLLTREQEAFRGYIDLMMRDVGARPAGEWRPVTPDEEDALRVLESTRVINFNAVKVARVDAATQVRIDDLLARMADKRSRMAATLSRETERGASSLAQVQLDIARLRAEIDLARAHGRRDDAQPGWAGELTQPWPTLQSDAIQLSYAPGEHFVYLWVRDSSGIRATRLALTPRDLERVLAEFMAGDSRTRAPAEMETPLTSLSAILLPPQAIGEDTRRIEVAAEGRIAAVPFAALRAPSDRTRRLADSRSVTMIASMFDDATSASQTHAAHFIGVAASRGESAATLMRTWSELAATRTEATSIYALFDYTRANLPIKLLDGYDADAATIKAAWSRGVDVMHFATHGLADVRQPLTSLLMLPALDGSGNATYLTAGQVQEWRGDVGLVYLGACETAVGPVRFADGMPGLQRAFLRAGAHGVIATLWPIEDVYASQFALDFYRRYTTGTPAAQALSETQRAWLAPVPELPSEEQEHRRMTAWAHAYYRR